jgi:hypothetical protein
MYYVYAYLRDDDTFYYIGKGKDRRAWIKGKGEVHPPVNKLLIKIIAHKLWENEAYNLEEKLILYYGRKDLGTGILRNKSDGGEGIKKPYNKVAWNKGLTKDDPRVEKNAKNISDSMKGYKRTQSHQEKLNQSYKNRKPSFKGKFHSEETKNAIRLSLSLKKKRKNYERNASHESSIYYNWQETCQI